MKRWPLRAVDGCPECGADEQTFHPGAPIACEWSLLVHLNNDHGYNFAKIAEIMPDDEVAG